MKLKLETSELNPFFWSGLALSALLLAIYLLRPSVGPIQKYEQMHEATLRELTPPRVPNPADPLDPPYRPRIDTNPKDYPGNVWVTDSLQKIHQDIGNPN